MDFFNINRMINGFSSVKYLVQKINVVDATYNNIIIFSKIYYLVNNLNLTLNFESSIS